MDGEENRLKAEIWTYIEYAQAGRLLLILEVLRGMFGE